MVKKKTTKKKKPWWYKEYTWHKEQHGTTQKEFLKELRELLHEERRKDY